MSVKYFIKSNIKNIMKSTFVIRFIAFMIYLYAKLIGKTCHWNFVNTEMAQKLNKNAIFVVWHSRATMMPFFYQLLFKRRMAALVSPHQDGQLIAYMLKHFRITPINGSSNENPRQAALELMRKLQEDYDICISPDGPRGPRMRMKKSPIYFASKTKKPIVCVCFSSSPAAVVKTSWDNMLLPLPFTKGIFEISDPLYIPENLDDSSIETYRQKLEDFANKQLAHCDAFVGRKPTLPADLNDYKKKENLSCL